MYIQVSTENICALGKYLHVYALIVMYRQSTTSQQMFILFIDSINVLEKENTNEEDLTNERLKSDKPKEMLQFGSNKKRVQKGPKQDVINLSHAVDNISL